MTTVEKTSAIRSLATAIVQAAGLKYASIAPYWTFKTAQGSLSLYDVAQAAGFSKADVQSAADKRQTRDGRDYYRIPVTIAAGTAARKTAQAGKTAQAAAFLSQSAGSVPRLVRGK